MSRCRCSMSLVAAALLLGLTVTVQPAQAADVPHQSAWPEGSQTCNSCHQLHNAPGGTITNTQGNANLCLNCHNSLVNPSFPFPWVSDYQAVPGVQGRSHRWDAPATNPDYGALPPLHPKMSNRLASGNLQCSTCHDQHTGASANRGRQHTSYKVGVAQPPTGVGSGTLTVLQPDGLANPKAYLVKIVTGGAVGVATFKVSNDNGTTWFGWNGSAWDGVAQNGRATGSNVALTDGTYVAVTFSATGTFAVDDTWKFYLSYPMLRIPNGSSQMCEDCHRDRVMTDVETGADGVKVFSHPVTVGLGKPYDRATPLDTNGVVQVSSGADADSNPTNNLALDGTVVRCMTCHNPHDADSNSLTEDAR